MEGDKNRKTNGNDYEDPRTGLHIASSGMIKTSCPHCGHENTSKVELPVTKFLFCCAACGKEYEKAPPGF